MQGFDISNVIADPRTGIVPALLFLGWLLKNVFPVANRWIPAILAAVGIVAGIVFYGGQLGYAGAIIVGFLYAAIAVGLHSGVKNTFEHRNASEGK
ncbi:MAG: phage holin family protein [Alicyclobacillaceae bacterium]|nr:phage holin family protein [Alicyclobacillaceae bacterium]